LYPFTLERSGGAVLSGAMYVTGVDDVVALATFGRSEETKLFDPEFIDKAKGGVLTHYTITFDGQPVIRYWLGNRTEPSAPGQPTVELDFSETDGVSSLKIDGKAAKGRVSVLDVYTSVPDPSTGALHRVPRTYRIEIRQTNGSRYVGYIRQLQATPFTTFVRVPCSIPSELFDAADQGTIAKFSVYPEGDKDHPVAEIIFGRD
jgi:hypothetical protein